MRIIVACSGAGGHLFAGLSIAEALRGRFPDIELIFLSSDYLSAVPTAQAGRTAKRLVKSAGYRFYRVYAKGLLNRNLCGITQFIVCQLICLVQSGWLLMFIRPRLIVGTGGFASVGIICLSRLFGIPTVLHEQNLIPGKANRLLAPLVDKILVSFQDTERYFKRYRCIVTGMPVRFKGKLNKIDTRPPTLRSPTLQSSGDGALRRTRIELGLAPDRFTILVMGGSRGAHRINQLIVDIIERLTDYKERIQFVHLTGTKDYEFVKEAYMKSGFKAYVERFSTKMDAIYNSVDSVISRSGSSSVSEITFFGLPAILIPYPYSRDKHQLRNAQVLAHKNAAVVIIEDEISGDRLAEVLTELINQPERLDYMARQSESLARPDAAETVVDELEELINAKCKISNAKLAL